MSIWVKSGIVKGIICRFALNYNNNLYYTQHCIMVMEICYILTGIVSLHYGYEEKEIKSELGTDN